MSGLRRKNTCENTSHRSIPISPIGHNLQQIQYRFLFRNYKKVFEKLEVVLKIIKIGLNSNRYF